MPVHGKGSGLVLGAYDVTRWCTSIDQKYDIDLVDVSCFDEPQGAKVYTQGMGGGTASFGGRQHDNGLLANLTSVVDGIQLLDMDAPISLAPGFGFVFGASADMGKALSTSANSSAPIADVLGLTGDLQINGSWRAGKVLTQKADYSTTGATNGASSDNGAASATSGAAHLHLTGNTRNGTAIVKVQHSTDGTTWVDLITFTTVAATTIAAERIELADGATINRYTRVLVTLAGTTGAVTARVVLARRK